MVFDSGLIRVFDIRDPEWPRPLISLMPSIQTILNSWEKSQGSYFVNATRCLYYSVSGEVTYNYLQLVECNPYQRVT